MVNEKSEGKKQRYWYLYEEFDISIQGIITNKGNGGYEYVRKRNKPAAE